jgi:rhamnulokinase
MPGAIQHFCTTTGQTVPADRGSLARVVLESLACKYRATLEQLEHITGRQLDVIHIVGGGSRNQLLCQFAANACARPVLAGPVEATALGNILAQAIAAGQCASWAEARDIVHAAFPPTVYEPHNTAAWDEAYDRFQHVMR